MAKIYETLDDVARDELSKMKSDASYEKDTNTVTAFAGVTTATAASLFTQLPTDMEASLVKKYNIVGKVIAVAGLVISAAGLVGLFAAHRKQKYAEKELARLGPEQVVINLKSQEVLELEKHLPDGTHLEVSNKIMGGSVVQAERLQENTVNKTKAM